MYRWQRHVNMGQDQATNDLATVDLLGDIDFTGGATQVEAGVRGLVVGMPSMYRIYISPCPVTVATKKRFIGIPY